MSFLHMCTPFPPHHHAYSGTCPDRTRQDQTDYAGAWLRDGALGWNPPSDGCGLDPLPGKLLKALGSMDSTAKQ